MDGVVAQLVERLVRNEKVAGSIPVGSTILTATCSSAIHRIKTSAKNQTPAGAEPLTKRLQAAAEILEAIAADRTLLAGLSNEERTRLLQAAGDVYCPDVKERRRLTKAKHRRHKAGKLERDQERLNVTGIRTLRRKPVFNTPNALPPALEEQHEVEDPDFREVVEPQN